MPLPTVTTEIAFASAWDSAAPTWVDVSSYVRAIDINRGRSTDLDAFAAGTATVQLDNRDGRFNPSNTAGPYSPNVRPRKQIRIRGTYTTPTRTNLCTNPSFESNTTGWGAYLVTNTRTAGTIAGGVGSWSLVSTATATGVGGCFFDNLVGVAGSRLTSSVNVLRLSGNRSYQIRYEFYNGAVNIGTSLGTANACATSTRLTLTATIPATTTRTVVAIYSSGTGAIGDAIQTDALLMEYSSTVGDYFDGSTNPAASWTGTANNSTSTFVGRANLCTNPSLETDATGWTSAQASTVRSGLQELYGEFSLQVPMSSLTDSNVGTFTFTAAAPGTYAISMYVYTPPLSSLAGRTVSVTREAGTATSTQTSQISPTLVGGQWVRISEIRNVTVAGTLTMVFRLSGTLSTAVGQTLYFDGALVEQSATVGDYFDGSSSALCSWTGTVNNSTSVEQTTTFPMFRGYVQTWPQEYPGQGEDAVTTITAVDALALLGGMTIPVDELTARVSAAELPAPFFRYKMGDTDTTSPRYLDASGNGRDMPSGSFQAAGPQLGRYLDDASSAFGYGNGASGYSIPPVATASWTVSFWMQSTQVGTSATNYATLFSMGVYDQIPTRIAIDENGYIYAKAYDFIPGFSPSSRSTVKVNDGVPHHVTVVGNGSSGLVIYIDGVDRTTYISATSGGHGGLVTIARPPVTNNAAGATDVDYYGFLQEVCYWQSALTSTQVRYVYGCGTGLATGELTSARFTRLLNAVWSGAPTAIATGNGYCSTAEYNNNALSALQKVSATEGGMFFVDRSGNIVLRNRYYSQTVTEGSTSQATFGDDTGIGYESMGFRYDADQMANTYVVNSGIGVPQTGEDSSSVTSYGRRTQNVDTLLSTVDALSMAQGLAAQYGQPLLRSLPFTVNLNANTATTAPAVLNLELGYEITLRRNANGVATPIVQTLTLNALSHSIRPGQWTTVLDGSPRQLFDYFILDSSTLDGASVLGY